MPVYSASVVETGALSDRASMPLPAVPVATAVTFHEVRFPVDISVGATGGPEFKTTILALGSGEEKRNIEWSLTRAQYNVGTGLRRRQDFDAFIQFFYARYGRAYGFRFKDWSDFFITNLAWTVGDKTPLDLSLGANMQSFQLFNEYVSGNWIFFRPILKPCLNPEQGANLLQVDSGSGPQVLTLVQGLMSGNQYNAVSPGHGQWTYDPTTGIVTLGDPLQVANANASPPQLASVVTVGYMEFDLPVRFDTDKLDLNMAAYEAGEWLNVPIVELKNGK